jgi:nucleotide-binding universal stress UspA family protein
MFGLAGFSRAPIQYGWWQEDGHMYGSIVVGTDGSESAQRAVAEAATLAEALGAKIHVLVAYRPQRVQVAGAPEGAARVWDVQPDTAAQSAVAEAAAGIRVRGVEVETHTASGDAADALIELAERENAKLIVVGSRGMHGMTRVLGSIPNKVSHRASCSVLIVSTDDSGS